MSIQNQTEFNQKMWHDFLTGNTHVLYGIIAVIVLMIIMMLTHECFIGVIILMILSALLVDLYVHGYTH